jgi:GrpB-like predicted nucleotidyltransferase (UPF0157 family)
MNGNNLCGSPCLACVGTPRAGFVYLPAVPFPVVGKDTHDVDESIEIVPYDDEWPARFEREMAAIQEVFDAVEIEVHHTGSTAVPGLAAKPIVDILVAVDSLEDRGAIESRLSVLGYANVPHDEDDKRLFFKKGVPRAYHVHVVKRNSWTYWKQLLFRDLLVSDRELRAEYGQLKLGLAARFRNDREAYSNAKTDFIERAVSRRVRGE